jgi:hypothetical protein
VQQEKAMSKKSRNIVSKYCSLFNKPKVEEDKKNVYKRKAKHSKKVVDYFLVFC